MSKFVQITSNNTVNQSKDNTLLKNGTFDAHKLQKLSSDKDSHAFTLAKLSLEACLKKYTRSHTIKSLEDLNPLLKRPSYFNNLAACFNIVLNSLNNTDDPHFCSEQFLEFSPTLSALTYPKLSVNKQVQLLSLEHPSDFLLNIKFSKNLIEPVLAKKLCYIVLEPAIGTSSYHALIAITKTPSTSSLNGALSPSVTDYLYFGNEYFDLYYFDNFVAEDLQSLDDSYVIVGDNLVSHGTLFKYHKILDLAELELILEPAFLCDQRFLGPFDSPSDSIIANLIKALPAHLGTCATHLIPQDNASSAQSLEPSLADDSQAEHEIALAQAHVPAHEQAQGQACGPVPDEAQANILQSLGECVDKLPLRLGYDVFYIALVNQGTYCLDVDNEQLKNLYKLAFGSLNSLLPDAISELISYYQSEAFNLEHSYKSIHALWSSGEHVALIPPILTYLNNHLQIVGAKGNIQSIDEGNNDSNQDQVLSLEEKDLLVSRLAKKLHNSLIILKDEDWAIALCRLFNIFHISDHDANSSSASTIAGTSSTALDHDTILDAFNFTCLDFDLVVQKGSGNDVLDYLLAAYAYTYKSNFLWVFERTVGSLIAHNCVQSLFFAPDTNIANFACPSQNMQNKLKSSLESEPNDDCIIVGTLNSIAKHAKELIKLPKHSLFKLTHNLILVGHDLAQLHYNYELMSLGSALDLAKIKPFIDQNLFKTHHFNQYQSILNSQDSNNFLEFCHNQGFDLNYPQEQEFKGETNLIIHRNHHNSLEISYLQYNQDLFKLTEAYEKVIKLNGLMTPFNLNLKLVTTDNVATIDSEDLWSRYYYTYDKRVAYYTSQLKLLHHILALDVNHQDENSKVQALYLLPVEQDVDKVRALINELEDFKEYQHTLKVASINSWLINKHALYQELYDHGCDKCLIVVDNLLAKELNKFIDIFKNELTKLQDQLSTKLNDHEISEAQVQLYNYLVNTELPQILNKSGVPASIVSSHNASCATMLSLYEQGINHLLLKYYILNYLDDFSSIFTCLLTGTMCLIQEQINAFKSSPLALIPMLNEHHHSLQEPHSIDLYCIDPILSLYNGDVYNSDDYNIVDYNNNDYIDNLFRVLDILNNFERVELPLFNDEEDLYHYHSLANKFFDQFDLATKDAIDILDQIETTIEDKENNNSISTKDTNLQAPTELSDQTISVGTSDASSIASTSDHIQDTSGAVTGSVQVQDASGTFTGSGSDLVQVVSGSDHIQDTSGAVTGSGSDLVQVVSGSVHIQDTSGAVTGSVQVQDTVKEKGFFNTLKEKLEKILGKDVLQGNDEKTTTKPNSIEPCKFFLNDLSLDKDHPRYQKAIKYALDEMYKALIDSNIDGHHKWHDYQSAAFPHILSKEQDCIISLPTGGGKSVLFQGPALFRALYSKKLSIVISPLKALILDQIITLKEKGFDNVDYLSSDRLAKENSNCFQKISSGDINLLYVTPERFRSRPFYLLLNSRLKNDGGAEYFIFDEAHCISQWGKSFRPDYIFAAEQCALLKNKYGGSFIMCSATMTKQVVNDIKQYLDKPILLDNKSNRYSPIREHIAISKHNVDQDNNIDKDYSIVEYIVNLQVDSDKSRMIIFCPTRKKCEDFSDYLNHVARQIALKLSRILSSELASQISSLLEKMQTNDSLFDQDQNTHDLSLSELLNQLPDLNLYSLINEPSPNSDLSKAEIFSDQTLVNLFDQIASLLKNKQEVKISVNNLDTLTKLAKLANFAKFANHVSYFHAGLSAKTRKELFELFKSHKDEPQNTLNRDDITVKTHDYQKRALQKELWSLNDSKELLEIENDSDSDSDELNDEVSSTGKEQIYILCSTNAFGMGLDIPNIHYVLHYSPPNLFENYLQEVGRAGRSYESYQEVFPDNQKIPTVCFYNTRDFEDILTKTNNNMISWNSLVSAEKAIRAYIQSFMSLKTAKYFPCIVPIEVINRNIDDILTPASLFTDKKSHIIFYYLEYFKRIRLTFRQPMPVILSLRKEKLEQYQKLNSNTQEKHTLDLVKHLIASLSVYEAQQQKDSSMPVNNTLESDSVENTCALPPAKKYSFGSIMMQNTCLQPIESPANKNLFLFAVKDFVKHSSSKISMNSVFNDLIELHACQALKIKFPFLFNFIFEKINQGEFFFFAKQYSLYSKTPTGLNDAKITKILPTLGVALAVVRELLDEAYQHFCLETQNNDTSYKLTHYYFTSKQVSKLLTTHLEPIKPYYQDMPWLCSEDKQLDSKLVDGYKAHLLPNIIKVLALVCDNLTRFELNSTDSKSVNLESSNSFALLAPNQSYHLLLDVLAQDALKLLALLHSNYNTSPIFNQLNSDGIVRQNVFNWPDLIAELELLHNDPKQLLDNYDLEQSRSDFDKLYMRCQLAFKPYNYFQLILNVLSSLKLTSNTPIWSIGYEVTIHENAVEPLDSAIQEDSPFYPLRKELELFDKINHTRALIVKVFFTCIKDSNRDDFIEEFFKIEDYRGYVDLLSSYSQGIDDSIMSELTSDALTVEEEKFKTNPEQKDIYEAPLNYQHINVISGPGSGKTFILTMKVARLIIHDHVPPQNILVLAYNRAVVTELKLRLNKLFTSLGLGRLGHRIHIFTFHGLARFCLKNDLNDINTNQWEDKFLEVLSQKYQEHLRKFKSLEYILIDEFQDITLTRLNILLLFLKFRPNVHFFTIGDINQSIYGFDRIKTPRDEYFFAFIKSLNELSHENTYDITYNQDTSYGRNIYYLKDYYYATLLSPKPYYDLLTKLLNPTTMYLSQNYRSYQGILDLSKPFLDNTKLLPVSNEHIQLYTTDNCALELDASNLKSIDHIFEKARLSLKEAINAEKQEPKDEHEQFIIDKAKRNVINTIAFLYRTNNDVYQSFASLDLKSLSDFDIHIQGSNYCEPYRKREFFAVANFFNNISGRIVINSNKKNFYGDKVKAFCLEMMKAYSNWDSYLLDIAYCLVLNFIDERYAQTNSDTVHISELKDYYYDILSHDDSLTNIYDKYQDNHLIESKPFKLVLSTIHKVKGLEFDMVVVMPSDAALPIKPHNKGSSELNAANNQADLQEERRLYYVAYTRAKKYLLSYQGPREKALKANTLHLADKQSNKVFVDIDPKLNHYYLGFSASSTYFTINDFLEKQVAINDQASICLHDGKYVIVHDKSNYIVGRLSSTSPIATAMKSYNISSLKGFFISNIITWRYEETLRSDENNKKKNPNSKVFASDWCEQAIQKGFVYLVMIDGYGTQESPQAQSQWPRPMPKATVKANQLAKGEPKLSYKSWRR